MEFIPAKSIVNRTKNTSWFGTDYNMNIYRGCSHLCIYCDSRSDCYKIDNFDKVSAKKDALNIINRQLASKVKTGVIATGSMSDPYNPMEAKHLLTRHALELVSAYQFGIAIATKSSLITRDIDILKEIREHSPVIAKITITTFDDELASRLEPSAPSSSERFEALGKLSDAGIFAGVLLMPVLPYINDNTDNILSIIKRAQECGARFIFPGFGVTLRDNQRTYFLDKLGALKPGLPEKYNKAYGRRYQCVSPNYKKLWEIFRAECDKLGILYKMQDIISGYKMGYGDRQLSFF